MDFFWKGSLVPLAKHISSVRFVRWQDMTEDDWLVLDYPFLRPAAKAALEAAIDKCQCNGFYVVDMDMHKAHGGKSKYYYPAKDDSLADLEGEEAVKRFGNWQEETYDKNVESPPGFQKKFREAAQYTREELTKVAVYYGVVSPYRWPTWALILFAAYAGYCIADNVPSGYYQSEVDKQNGGSADA